MYVLRVPVCGGFVYRVYSTEVSHAVDSLGVCYHYSLGWHPETNALVRAETTPSSDVTRSCVHWISRRL